MSRSHELWKSQCFFISNFRTSSNLPLKHLLRLCFAHLFFLFFNAMKKTNLQFPQNENLSVKLFPKKMRTVGLSDIFVFWVYSRIAGWGHIDQDQIFDPFSPYIQNYTTWHTYMPTHELMAQKRYFLGCSLCLEILFKLSVACA